MKKLLIILLCFFSAITIYGCKRNISGNITFNATHTLGTWWWNDQLNADTYLNFASTNNVNNIYYCSSQFNSNTASFIQKANNKSINVYYLVGEYEWLENPSSLYSKIEKYIEFQSLNTYKFKGIHLDIEPHQHPNFEDNRKTFITLLITLANTLKNTYPEISFDYDIPFWFDDEITYNNQTKPAYAHMIDVSNAVHIMSYRDTAEKIFELAKDEIEYANLINKKIYLGVETKSTEGDNVSFMEEGKQAMYTEINKLKNMVNRAVGINIHSIQSWYDLK